MSDAFHDVEAEDSCCCPGTISREGIHALRRLCSCPPDAAPTISHGAKLIQDAGPVIANFTDTTIVYVQARMWADLLFIYVFRLVPRPFCDVGKIQDQCGATAPGWQQLLVAVALPLALSTVGKLGPGTATRDARQGQLCAVCPVVCVVRRDVRVRAAQP